MSFVRTALHCHSEPVEESQIDPSITLRSTQDDMLVRFCRPPVEESNTVRTGG